MMGDIYAACEKVYLWLGMESEESDRWCQIVDYESCGQDRLDQDFLVSPSSSRIAPKSDVSLTPLASPYALPHRGTRGDRTLSQCRRHGRRPRMSEAFALLHMFAEDLHLNAIPGLVKLTFAENTDRHTFVEPFQALTAMMRRPWFHRVWTVQEAVLPKNGVIMCGSLEMDWAIMMKAAMNWRRHVNTCCSVLKERLYEVLNYPVHGEPAYLSLSTFHRTLIALNDLNPQTPGSERWDFISTLPLFSNRQASDPRDKVYGVLGILVPQNRPILADYGIPMEDLNRRLSRQLLLSGRLAILHDSSRPIDHAKVPSWVRDFGQTVNPVTQRIHDFRRQNISDYKASGTTSASVRVCTKMTISFSALWIGKVYITNGAFTASQTHADMQTYFRQCATLVDFSNRKNSTYQWGGTLREAFLRTAFGDRCRTAGRLNSVHRPKEKELQILEEWIWELEDIPSRTQAHLGNNIKYGICDRAFFTTTDGSMGFGPSNMRAGDEVWVLFGTTAPIVLRPLETTTTRGEDSGVDNPHPGFTATHHRAVLGDCYLHGIMDGEALVDGIEMRVLLRRRFAFIIPPRSLHTIFKGHVLSSKVRAQHILFGCGVNYSADAA